MSGLTENPGIFWATVRGVLRRVVFGAAGRVIPDRTLHTADGRQVRWLGQEIEQYTAGIESVVGEMRKTATHLPDLGTGNRIMAELALYTVAGFRQLRHHGLAEECAREVTADLGWHVYRRMLGLYSFPVRLLTRDPARRLDWTVRLLMRFPFNPGEPHGYAVKTWRENGNVHTHFTRCPPQSVARAVAESENDPAILGAFYQSWCLYDWPGADVIAGDGKRGHYARPSTLSLGDPVCDMCWIGQVDRRGGGRSENGGKNRQTGGRRRYDGRA